MEDRRPAGWAWVGFAVALLGAVAFVVSCFLPYYADPFLPPSSGIPSLYRTYTIRDTIAAKTGGFLYLFAGPAIIAGLSIAGLRRPQRWAAPSVAAASSVWSAMWIGSYLNTYGLFSGRRFGYWSVILSVGTVAVGAIILWITRRSDEPAPNGV